MQDDPDLQEKVFEDWIEIIGRFPAWAIKNACLSYLAGPDCRKKPTPGVIAELAAKEFGFVWEMMAAARKFEKSPPKIEKPQQTEAERAEVVRRLRGKLDFMPENEMGNADPHAKHKYRLQNSTDYKAGAEFRSTQAHFVQRDKHPRPETRADWYAGWQYVEVSLRATDKFYE